MLQELSIQNLALIEKLQLNFQTGFTTLTGETGAGKSILLDGLGLALGERADSGLVRHGTQRADITANFEIDALPGVQTWLAEHELDDDNQCLLRRTVTAEGRSKAYINGLPASVSQLKSLSELLIDIHGQHEHQSLMRNSQQLALLDAYAQHPKSLENTRKKHQAWSKLNQQYQQLLADQTDRQSKLELLSFQAQEFDKVIPTEGEFDSLSEEQNTLSHANEIKQAVSQAYEALDGEQGAAGLIHQAMSQLEGIADYQPSLQSAIEQLNTVLIDCQEIANDLQSQDSHIELDPMRLQAVDERLSDLFGLAKKYQLEPNQLVAKQQDIQQQLADLQNSDANLEQLKQEIEQAWQAFQTEADKLTASRQKAAKKLSKIVTDTMHTLGMENGEFAIAISAVEQASALGQDSVLFQVSANKGQPLQPLAKVASGGELSRISLAIQVACAEVASLPTLIFDEVDVGIGGGIAEVVGQKMQQLGQHRQILSITHLAQVAAFGNQHLNISKSTQKNSTTTQVVTLTNDERVEEIARMLGGQTLTEQTRKHANEMLGLAQKR